MFVLIKYCLSIISGKYGVISKWEKTTKNDLPLFLSSAKKNEIIIENPEDQYIERDDYGLSRHYDETRTNFPTSKYVKTNTSDSWVRAGSAKLQFALSNYYKNVL